MCKIKPASGQRWMLINYSDTCGPYLIVELISDCKNKVLYVYNSSSCWKTGQNISDHWDWIERKEYWQYLPGQDNLTLSAT